MYVNSPTIWYFKVSLFSHFIKGIVVIIYGPVCCFYSVDNTAAFLGGPVPIEDY
jgi:hypothetical protein